MNTNGLVIEVLAAQPEGPEFGKASPLGLLIIIVLLVATALLIRSMNKQLKKLPKTFDAEHPEADQAFDDGTDSVPESDVAGQAAPAGSADADAQPAEQSGSGERKSADT